MHDPYTAMHGAAPSGRHDDAIEGGREGVVELLALFGWLLLLVLPWAIHVLAVTRVITPQLFWLAAPSAVLGVPLWVRLSGAERGTQGFAARGTMTLCASAAWLVVQTVVALVLFLVHELDDAGQWLYALWLVAASLALAGLLWRPLRSGSSRPGSRHRA